MIELSQQKFDEVKGIAESLERHIRKLQAQGVAPSVSHIRHASRMNAILDECLADYERELKRMEYEQHKHDGYNCDNDTDGGEFKYYGSN